MPSWDGRFADEVAARSAEIDDREFLAELFAQRGIVSDKIDDWVRRKQVLDGATAQGFAPTLSGMSSSWSGSSRAGSGWRSSRAPGARTSRPSSSAAGLARLLRDDRRQGGRDGGQAGPGRLSARVADGSGSSAKSAVALEDSPTGLASARAAGIRVIAVGHRHPFGDWVGDALYISGFEPVEGLLRNLGL